MRTFKMKHRQPDGLAPVERVWEIDIHPVSLDRVKAHANVDLLDLGNPDLLTRLAADPMLAARAIPAIVKPQLEKAGMTAEEFLEDFQGDQAQQAMDALVDALVDFFPSERQRTNLRMALTLIRSTAAELETRAGQKLQDPEVLRKIEQQAQRLSDTSGNSPESSELTQVTSPSES